MAWWDDMDWSDNQAGEDPYYYWADRDYQDAVDDWLNEDVATKDDLAWGKSTRKSMDGRIDSWEKFRARVLTPYVGSEKYWADMRKRIKEREQADAEELPTAA
jgi:hypothetical protein